MPDEPCRPPPFNGLDNELSDPLHPHDIHMLAALEQARMAFELGEVPVGAVIVHDGRVIAAGYNQRETLRDPTAHAEMIVLTQAAAALGTWRLLDCTLYVTLEPCPMCAGAIVQARLPRLIYGAVDAKAGACETLYQIPNDPRLNHQVAMLGGVLSGECRSILQDFFRAQRAQGKK